MAVHIETGTMAPLQYYSSKQLDHLGLVAGRCDELGMVELIAPLIPRCFLNHRNVLWR
jgi:hypothetical protein